MTATTSTRRTAPGSFRVTFGWLAWAALTPVLCFTAAAAAFLLVIAFVARWQGWDMVMTPGTDTDGVWLGVEASADRVVLRGLGFLVPVGAGIGAVALAGGVTSTMTRPLIELGVTRRVVAAASLATVGALGLFVLMTVVLTSVAVAPTDPVSWWRTTAGALPALAVLAVAMLAVLVTVAVTLRFPGRKIWVALLAMIVAVGFALGWLGVVIPFGPLTALVLGAVLIGAYLALMRRMPVP